jgi:hypothetical protein
MKFLGATFFLLTVGSTFGERYHREDTNLRLVRSSRVHTPPRTRGNHHVFEDNNKRNFDKYEEDERYFDKYEEDERYFDKYEEDERYYDEKDERDGIWGPRGDSTKFCMRVCVDCDGIEKRSGTTEEFHVHFWDNNNLKESIDRSEAVPAGRKLCFTSKFTNIDKVSIWMQGEDEFNFDWAKLEEGGSRIQTWGGKGGEEPFCLVSDEEDSPKCHEVWYFKIDGSSGHKELDDLELFSR